VTAAKPEEPQRYQVTAPCVVVRVPNGPGGAVRSSWQLIHLYQHAWIPVNIHPDDLARLLKTRRPGPTGRGGGGPLIVPVTPSGSVRPPEAGV
jgi:hypothetical protein